MDVIILAETETRESYEITGLAWYKQYAIGVRLSSDEINDFVLKYGMREIYGFSNPVITLSRRVDNNMGVIKYWEWNVYDCLKSENLAIQSFADSDYWNRCKSVDKRHADVVVKGRRYSELRKELEMLNNEITPAKFQRVSNLRAKYESMYDSELKSKKLYSKAQKGLAPQPIIDEIRGRIAGEYKQQLAQVEGRIKEIESELAEI